MSRLRGGHRGHCGQPKKAPDSVALFELTAVGDAHTPAPYSALQRMPSGTAVDAEIVTFWSVATMATMATPADQPLKKNLFGISWLVIIPLHLLASFFFSSFNLGVAMVAIVAIASTSAPFPPGASC